MQNKWESSSMFTKKGRPSGKGGACGSTKSALHKLAVQGMLKFFHPRRPSHSPGKGRCSYRDGFLPSRDSCERLALDRFLKRKSFIHTGRAGSHFCAKANKRGSRRIIHPAAPSGPLAKAWNRSFPRAAPTFPGPSRVLDREACAPRHIARWCRCGRRFR